jgi:plastocyanin
MAAAQLGRTLVITMRKLVLGITALAAAASLSACGAGSSTSASAPFTNPMTAALQITHVQVGCHAWLSAGGVTSPTEDVYLSPGGTLTITNNDVMPHLLIGTGAQIGGANMNHMGASATLTFPRSGIYTFTTRAGEDYVPGVQTVGDDNKLRLTVVVT